MTFTTIKNSVDFDAEYCEETVKVPLLTMVVVVLLISAPLVWMIMRINEAGTRATSVSEYSALVEIVNYDVTEVSSMLSGNSEVVVKLDQGKPVVTLVVPELVLIDEGNIAPQANLPLDVQLDAIYWHSVNPIVGIGKETYQIGDSFQGYEIVKIGKTDVHFKGKNGKIVVKDFYENLFQSKK